MFDVIGRQVTITSGDTGIFDIVPDSSGRIPSDSDIAVFTVKDRIGGKILIQKKLTPNEKGIVTVVLNNSDTDKIKSGSYVWDIRYVVSPTYDSKGNITDGEEITTPFSYAPFVVVEAVSFI